MQIIEQLDLGWERFSNKNLEYNDYSAWLNAANCAVDSIVEI
jgi:hypothetical protein